MQLPQSSLAEVSSASLRQVKNWSIPARKGNEWQRDAYAYNEMIGEVGYLHNLTANLVSTCELRVVEEEWEGTGFTMTVSSDERALRVMQAFIGPQGGQKELKRRAALHLQIAGESYLLGTPLKDSVSRPAGIAWEFVSTEEVKVSGGAGSNQRIQRNAAGAGDRDAGFIDVDAFIARLWRPDPRYSLRADSPMKRVMPICRELIVLSELVDSIAKSRLSSGLLFVPEELSFGPVDETQGLDDTDDMDEFIETLVQHMSAPVEDRTSAAGLVPLVVRGAAEYGDKIRLIELARDLDVSYQALRDELLKRLAQGLDAPPEVIGGKSGLNHWSSYNVDSDFISKHVNPVGEMIAEFVTVAYMRPMLMQFEGMNEHEVLRYRLVFDSRMLTARSDEGPAATGAWDRLTLSDAAYLRSNGFSDEDYPESDERRRRMIEKVLLADPANYGPLLLPKLYPELADVFGKTSEPKPLTKVSPAESQRLPAAPTKSGAEEPDAAPASPRTGAEPVGASSVSDDLSSASEVAIDKLLQSLGIDDA